MSRDEVGQIVREYADVLFLRAPPCWEWHRPLTLCDWDDGLSEEERNKIYRQGEIAGNEISLINVLRYKQAGPAWVPRL